MTNDNIHFYKKGLITGSTVIASMLSGQLLLENIKMEKQRTILSYPKIFKNLISQGSKGYLSGFIPWGFALGYGKGFIVGSVSNKINNLCYNNNINKNNTAIISGIGTGISEALYTNPIFMARSKINAHFTHLSENKLKSNWKNEFKYSCNVLNNQIKTSGLRSLYNGLPILISKRMVDWIGRFYIIQLCQNKISNNNDNYKLSLFEKFYTTAFGAALATPLSMPFDRILPIIYNSNNIKDSIVIIKNRIRREGITTFYRGLSIRTLSTVHYTLFALFLPQ